ncbi:MAG TPA: helix-turn-helix domain-containing protein, partial [Burkholderiaceae bacterium]|nr:helix-turn-helix domain-containing protein [Burkholderiaceae bacterium]
NLIERILVFREHESETGPMTDEELREIAPELFTNSDINAMPGEQIHDIRALERRSLEQALQRAGGRRDEAARLLGISRTTLWRRLRDLQADA